MLLVIGLLVITVMFAVAAILVYNSYFYNDQKTKIDCLSYNVLKLAPINDGDDCAIWKDNKCHKSKVINGECKINKPIIPIILAILAGISAAAALFYLFLHHSYK